MATGSYPNALHHCWGLRSQAPTLTARKQPALVMDAGTAEHEQCACRHRHRPLVALIKRREWSYNRYTRCRNTLPVPIPPRVVGASGSGASAAVSSNAAPLKLCIFTETVTICPRVLQVIIHGWGGRGRAHTHTPESK